MTKHTNGPWEAGPMEGSQGVRIWQTDNDKNIKAIIGFVIQRKPSRELDAETEANARLITAAPEMFAALQWFDEQMRDDNALDMGKLINEMEQRTRKAITKATQEQAI